VLDFATSQISGGKIDYLIEAGLQTPPDALLDASGNPTVDPSAWKAGGMLLPFGAHKGYALSLLIALLAGCVVGQAEPDNPRHGVFAFAVDPGAFAESSGVLDLISTQLKRMRDTAPQPGFERVEVPGDYERRNRQAQQASVPIADATWEKINALAESLGVSLPKLKSTGGEKASSTVRPERREPDARQ
jgi:L-lactate dehydrogenase